jgi:cobalt-precorrin-7 (C5)-methyltransferase
MQKIYIIGCGPGSREYLTLAAIDLVARAGLVMGPPGLVSLFGPIPGRVVSTGKKTSLVLEEMAKHFPEEDIVLLVGGDPGCFSLSRLVINRFGLENCRVIPGISSVQLGLSRIGKEWTRARVMSAHGRDTSLLPGKICGSDLCVVLLGSRLDWLGPFLSEITRDKTVYLMQDLGLQGESISIIKSDTDLKGEISPKSLLVITI